MNSIFVVILFLLIISVIVFAKWYKSSAQKGKRGEAKVHNILALLPPDDYRLLDDVVLVTDRGTTQIDHVVVSRFGLFVIETKNYTGDIYGDDNRKEWTQIIPTNVTYRIGKTYTYITKNKFYNPVKQTLMHLYELKKNLNDFPDLKYVPIVVFVGNADLSHVESTCHVVYRSDLLATIKSYRYDVISDEDAESISERLATRNVRTGVSNTQHVQNIKKSAVDVKRKVYEGICPRCGGNLVKRTGSYGSFLGCSNYPNCKYTTKNND